MALSLNLTIKKGPALYEAWTTDIPGIYGTGKTVEEAKKDIENTIKEIKDGKYGDVVPVELQGEIEFVLNLDIQSFLELYSYISKSALENITGVNQKLLGHYASGLKKPRKAQIEKIESSLRIFLDDLKKVHII